MHPSLPRSCRLLRSTGELWRCGLLQAPLLIMSALVSILLLPDSASCQAISSAGLGQEFNTSEATDGSSVTALISPTGNFALDLFDEGESAPPFYTLGITTSGDGLLISIGSDASSFRSAGIWTANVANPIKNNCTLHLQQDGNLVLLDYNSTVYWQTNTSNKGVLTMALLDTGNLVLLDAANGTIWQSFDHPSDTLVLGQHLTAGASTLTQGPYSLGLYDTGLYLLYSNGGGPLLPYWQLYPDAANGTGHMQALGKAEVARDALQMFAHSNSSALVGSIQFPAFDNASASDHSWWLLQLNTSGFLQGFRANSTHPQSSFTLPVTMPPCGIPDSCKASSSLYPSFYDGPYYVCWQDSGNCSSCPLVLPVDLLTLDANCNADSILAYPNCSTQEDIAAHRFLNLSGFTYYALAYNLSILSASLEDCADICMRNCSCKAAFYVTTTSSCLHVEEVSNLINATNLTDHLAFIKYQEPLKSSDQPPVPSPHSAPAGPFPGSSEAQRGSATGKTVGAVIGGIAAALLIMVICFCYLCKKMRQGRSDDEDDEEVFLGTLPGLPPRFSFKEIKACTDNFSRKLGAGGYGVVFEGVNPRDKEKLVAVKQLELSASTQGSRQFQAEIATIGSIQHVNLVRLHGFCMEGPHRLLVYELMSNGSLDAYLRKPKAPGIDHANRHEPLPWPKRLGIALGTARGLTYLHDECRERIIHCDIKPENILLNHRLEPVISDFGLAKLMSREQSYAPTTLRGTRGYLGPEWWRNAPLTEKSDVYSYGMVLLELVSGRRLFDAQVAISERRFLPEWALSLEQNHENGRAAFREFIDERLLTGKEEVVQEEVENAAGQVVAIALLCIQEDPNARPSMAMVVKMLQGDVEVPTIPRSTTKAVFSHVSFLHSSANPLTISSIEPR